MAPTNSKHFSDNWLDWNLDRIWFGALKNGLHCDSGKKGNVDDGRTTICKTCGQLQYQFICVNLYTFKGPWHPMTNLTSAPWRCKVRMELEYINLLGSSIIFRNRRFFIPPAKCWGKLSGVFPIAPCWHCCDYCSCQQVHKGDFTDIHKTMPGGDEIRMGIRAGNREWKEAQWTSSWRRRVGCELPHFVFWCLSIGWHVEVKAESSMSGSVTVGTSLGRSTSAISWGLKVECSTK